MEAGRTRDEERPQPRSGGRARGEDGRVEQGRPGGERWAEDAADFNDEFRDEITEAWNQFDEEIKEANEAAADAASSTVPPNAR